MSRILEHFKTLSQIPHCSCNAKALKEFLVDFASRYGYSVDTDKSDNILICKEYPLLALQAHYDMVCMGEAPKIEIYEQEGLLRAKNASLGADNGIAIAMMMVLMEDGYNLEFILTSDEEVGLIGANNIDFELKSHYMLNLDSEEEGTLCIGCAGGVDLIATQKEEEIVNSDTYCYEVSISGLPGGHSGVDIDKDIPNAIKILVKFAQKNNATILSINGGERSNSIPASAKAVISCVNELQSIKEVAIKPLYKKLVKPKSDIAQILDAIPHGVIRSNEAYDIPDISQNLAIVHSNKDALEIQLSIRAMSMDDLEMQAKKMSALFEYYGCSVQKKDKYPAWTPERNDFTNIIEESLKGVFKEVETKAIHAGLECGVLKEKYPDILFGSIGPTIRYPHSTREEVDMKSVEKTFEVVKSIIKEVNK
ncbi:MAG: M20/M25/M40 family metallo-hydrolase [Campylobacterales bacterium]|nr:M20/M25/M40 family metallo-hydrolase [Campylobacterales bacterium]